MNPSEREPPASGHPQRQHLTLVFMDLSASSRLAEQLEAERFARILDTLRRVCRNSIEQHGGRIVRIQGDGVLAVFGLPSPREDDAVRATQAVLDAHATFDGEHRDVIAPSLRPLQLHSGLHSGTVLVADGDIERGRFELVGDAANTAARLAQLAPAGALLVDVESLGPHAAYFVLDTPRLLTLPGRAAPVRAARVAARSAVRHRIDGAAERGLTPLAGRSSALAALRQRLLTPASVGAADPIELVGTAGIGKSRLLDEIAALPEWAQGTVLRGNCADETRSQPLHPFVELAARQGWQPPAGGSWHLDALAARLHEVVGQAAAPLLLLDDWQWADDASRSLLDRLLAAGPRLKVVLARRPSDAMPQAAPGADPIVLGALAEADTARIAARWLPAVDPFTIADIHRRTGGVPLFVEEMAQSVQAHGRLLAGAGGTGWLARLIASRLELLSIERQEVVRTAAVLGRSFPRRLLLTVGGWRERDLDLEALAEADFLFVDGPETVRFKHGLTRDAVYDSVALHERRTLHRRAARALAAEPSTPQSLEALAYHAHAAGLWDEAADHAQRAAEEAMSAFAMDVARRHFMKALEALEQGGLEADAAVQRWCLLTHRLGMTCIFDPLALPDALPIFERCRRRALTTGDAGLIARSEYWLGYICFGMGWPRRAVQHLRAGLDQAGSDERLRAQLEATLGQALAAASDYEAALPLMKQALTSKRHGAQRSPNVAVGSAFTLACIGSLQADRGEFDAAQASLDEATALLDGSTHPVANSVRNWAMIVLAWQGRWDEALAVVGACTRLANATQALLPLAISRATEGYVRCAGLGEPGGLDLIVCAVDWMEQRHCGFFTSIYYGWLVEAWAERGDERQARRHAAALFRRARRSETLGLGDGCRALALLAQRAGRAAEASRYMAIAESCARRRQSRREQALNLLALARLAALKGDARGARSRAIEADALFEAMKMHWHRRQLARSALDPEAAPGDGDRRGALAFDA